MNSVLEVLLVLRYLSRCFDRDLGCPTSQGNSSNLSQPSLLSRHMDLTVVGLTFGSYRYHVVLLFIPSSDASEDEGSEGRKKREAGGGCYPVRRRDSGGGQHDDSSDSQDQGGGGHGTGVIQGELVNIRSAIIYLVIISPQSQEKKSYAFPSSIPLSPYSIELYATRLGWA